MSCTILTVKIPFPGFYHSFISSEIDSTIEREIEYRSEENLPEIDTRLVKVDHEAIAESYCACWMSAMAEFTGVKTLELAEYSYLWRPREYNFQTDEIYAEVPLETLKALLKFATEQLEPDGFKNYVRWRMVPSSPDVPYYSEYLELWGEPEDWEGVKWELLLEYIDKTYNESDSTIELGFIEFRHDDIYNAVDFSEAEIENEEAAAC